MSNEGKVFELAILGRVTWQLHSLNNEGTIGNVTEPRSLRIIDPVTKEIVTTDGISGEMLKHIHAEMMWRLEKDRERLCDACKSLEPSRFDFVIQKDKGGKGKSGKEVVDEAIEKCEICDVHGFLIQEPTVNRQSLIEFGWAVALPEKFYRDIHTHARHDAGKKSKGSEPTQQMVYHRPTRAGVYAILTLFQPWKIGLNNVDRTYVIDDDGERKKRYEIVLNAYRHMFLQPEGAMSTTRLPHVVDFEGVIIYTTDNIPVPKISPLKDNYVEDIRGIIESIDKDSIHYEIFENIKTFSEKMNILLNKDPYKI